MPRCAIAPILTVALLALVACGGSEDSGDRDDGAGTAAAATTSGDGSEVKAAQSRGVKLVGVGTFDEPVYVTAPRGERRRIFVVEQGGTIRVVRGGKRVGTPFLDLRSRVTAGGEQGLLSMAFAPDYAKTRRFYVNYTDRSGFQRVVEYRRSKSNAERADGGSARLVLRYDGIEANHNGGLILFGPDKLMYIGTGDGGGADDQHGSRGNGRTSASSRASCCASTRAAPAGARTACRRATRS